jgi:hypothetical protein
VATCPVEALRVVNTDAEIAQKRLRAAESMEAFGVNASGVLPGAAAEFVTEGGK